MGNDTMTKGKLWRWFGVAIVIMMTIGCSDDVGKYTHLESKRAENIDQAKAAKNKVERRIHEGEAVELARSVYRIKAKYDSKIGILDPYILYETDNGWIVKIEGDLKNVFGAWVKVYAHCEVPFERQYDGFDLRNVAKFEFIR